MKNEYVMISDLLNSGIGDKGRLEFMLDCLNSDKPLYNSDMIYLQLTYDQLESKINALTTPSKTPISNSQKTLISDDMLNDILDSQKQISKNNILGNIPNDTVKINNSSSFLTSFVMGLSVSLSLGLGAIILLLLV